MVLPCAGKGTRLGLPYPKEIHRITRTKSLVDFSLEHVLTTPSLVSDVVTVLAPGKEPVFDFISDRLQTKTQSTSVYFNDAYTEWPGSIRSAEDHFLKRNVAKVASLLLDFACLLLLKKQKQKYLFNMFKESLLSRSHQTAV